jgi:hypothetical protein
MSERQARRLDCVGPLESVEALADLGDVVLFLGSSAHRRIVPAEGVEPVEELGIDRVVESLELPVHMLDMAGEVGVFGEPSAVEGSQALEFGDAALRGGDPAVECVGHRGGVRDPVLLGTGFGGRSDSGEPAPVGPFTSPHCQLGAALGGPSFLTRLVELASGSASRGVGPPTGPTVEMLAGSAQPVEVLACRGEISANAGRAEPVQCGQLCDEPCPLGGGIGGQQTKGRVDAGLRGAADPSLVALERPAVGDVLDGLVEVVGDAARCWDRGPWTSRRTRVRGRRLRRGTGCGRRFRLVHGVQRARSRGPSGPCRSRRRLGRPAGRRRCAL